LPFCVVVNRTIINHSQLLNTNMSTIIEYSDGNFRPITIQQMQLADEIFKHTYVDGELRLIEKYRTVGLEKKKVQFGGEYYLQSEENLQEIIATHVHTAKSWMFYFNKEVNTYQDEKWEFELYINGVLKRRGGEVYDIQERLIASYYKDLVTDVRTDRRKHFYGNPTIFQRYTDWLPSYTFTYGDDDLEVENVYFGDWDLSLPDFLDDDDEMTIFPWNDHPYYHSFEPLLPTTNPL